VIDYYATLVPEIKPEVLKKKMAESEKQKELADMVNFLSVLVVSYPQKLLQELCN
jgi:hypothetical protein